jgi:hypothetical protein
MKRSHPITTPSRIALAVAAAIGCAAGTAGAYESPVHVFSIADIQGGFDGSTFGPNGATQRKDILCGVPEEDVPACPDGVSPFVDKAGNTLYPVDSEFGFHVVDFVGAEAKDRDFDYGEGWAGNIVSGGTLVGVALSNAETDRYKVKGPLGTWCQGIGGNSVKCSTEHYTVMEHVLSCHELIPYFFADPETGEQGIQSTPSGNLSLDCATADLDDELIRLVGGLPDGRLTDATPGVQMDANDNTSVLDDIAASADYSVTLKDDGKPLYRWGTLIKRPNDLRLYARLALPEAWKERDAQGNLVNDFKVTKARLVIEHLITNNPNDQVRPEDLENEAATGRTPDYQVAEEGIWKSTKPCFEGDADLIDNEDGTFDPSVIEVGTYFKNAPYAVTEAPVGSEPGADPYPFSADLTGAFTNAWYTTIDRDPFEWSYLPVNRPAGVFDFQGFALPQDGDASLALVSGPRWRLKANKFGQDIPGLEIPVVECSPPPFTKENIKYEVGAPTTVVLNLLDWDESEGPSPLATSKGWVDVASNLFVETDGVPDANGGVRQVSTNGLPMSEDFDLAVYVKGDRKPTELYTAQLFIEYEGETPVEPDEVDMALTNLSAPLKVSGQTPGSRIKDIAVTACNTDPTASAQGTVTLTGTSLLAGVPPVTFQAPFSGLAPGACVAPVFTWTAPSVGTSISWLAEVDVTGGLVDPNPANDTATAQTLVYPLR